MAATGSDSDMIIAAIGDEDTVTGLVLGGVGSRDSRSPTVFAVTPETTLDEITRAFETLVNRGDVAVIIIGQRVANEIRHVLNRHRATLPTVLEIPDRDVKFDASQDPIMARVMQSVRSGSS